MAASSLEKLQQNFDHVLIGAAVQRAFQRADGRGDRRIDIRERGGRHARSEGGCVQLVIGVQDQSHVEGVFHHVVRTLAGQRVQEVLGETHGRVARDDVQPLTHAVERGHDGACLRHQPQPLALVRVRRHIGRLRIVDAQHRDRRPQHIHGTGLRHSLQEIYHGGRNPPIGGQALLQLFQFVPLRQPPIPQQEDDFFKSGVVGQRVNIIAAIAEYARVSVDVTDLGLAGDHAFQTCYGCAHLYLNPLFHCIYCPGGQPGSGEKPMVRSSRCTHSLSS